MWKEYSRDDIRYNRASSMSVVIAVLISALLLSLLCGVLYNFWNYDVVRVKTEDGDYHARLTGTLTEEDVKAIQGYANVENVRICREVSEDGRKTADIRLRDASSAYEDLPKIAALAGLDAGDVTYHEDLLNLLFVVNPDRPDALDVYAVLIVFAGTALCACFSLILIIHHSFAVFMNEKIRQLGILSSVGASPAQIRTVLLQEAAALSVLPAAAGILLGIGAAAGMMAWVDWVRDRALPGTLDVPFSYHPLVLCAALLCVGATVMISAWMPAWKLGRICPIEAVRGSGERSLTKKKESRLLGALFGIEGELAGNALRARRRSLRTASFSLTFSFLAFGFMLCFFSISSLSTQISYFDGSASEWDVMVTVKNTDIEEFDRTEEIRHLSGVRDAAVYQKARAKRFLTEEELSGEFRDAGGFEGVSETYVTPEEGGWLINAPVWILDDASFLQYCGQIGVEPRLDGAVVLNQVRDDTDPNFRVRNVFPYLKEGQETAVLYCAGQEGSSAGIRVLGYAQELPALREEYQTLDYYEMIHVLPVSLWEEIEEEIEGAEEDMYIRVFAEENVERAGLEALERELAQAIGGSYEIESENRIGEEEASDSSYRALMTIIGGFCILLAMIGIGNVFTNTLGFARERRREVARYLSVGMTPQSIRKMFCVEALVLAGRPVLVTLPVLAVISWIFMRVAYLDPALLLRCMPAAPLLAFVLADFAFVGLAYYIGGRTVLRMNLADALRDDTLQ